MPNMVISGAAVDLPLSGAWEQLRNREDRINDKKEKPQQREANNEADRKEQHEDEAKWKKKKRSLRKRKENR